MTDTGSHTSGRAALPTVDALALQALEGDEQAFEELYRRLGGGLRRYFQKRVGMRPEIIEELSQDTWVEVWRALDDRRYDPSRARISTFAYAIGRKMLLRHLRARQREERTFAGAAAPDPVWQASASDDAMHLAELLDAVRDCVRRAGAGQGLTEEERIVVLAAADGASERTLAVRLGVAPSTINARKKAGLAKIRAYLAARGFAAAGAEQVPAGSEQRSGGADANR